LYGIACRTGTGNARPYHSTQLSMGINHYTELEYEDKVLEVQAKSDDLYKTMLLGGEEFEEEEEIDLLSIDFNTSKPSN